MTIKDILSKEKGNYKVIVVNGIIKNGFTESSINKEVKTYKLENEWLRITTN